MMIRKRFSVLVVFLLLSFFLLACMDDVDLVTITFESNGGSPVSSMTTEGNSAITIPQDPTRDGYVFGGWYWDNTTFNDPFTAQSLLNRPVTSNLTVYAKWNEEESPVGSIMVSFDSKGGSDVVPQYVQKGSTITIPIVSREGHTLEGWYTSINQGVTLDERWSFTTSVINNEITLYAKWQINTYTISFDSNGGSSISPATQDYDTFVMQPYDPSKTGYTFDGWYSDSELTEPYEFTTMPAQDIMVYAKWQINEYTITFNSNDGSPVEPITQDYGTEVMEPATPERVGYTFAGWFVNPQMTVPHVFDTMPAVDMTLHAKWQINAYTITFDSNGGSEVPSMTLDYDTIVSEPEEPVREGYTFAGWYDDENFNDIYVFNRMPAEDITVYALWHNTISFESNGGSYVPAIIMRAGEETQEPETPTKEGHTFIAWFIDEELTEEFVFSTMPEPNIALYAKWQINQYTVTFETNGGEPWDSVTLDYGTSLADYQQSREGYVFMGWYLEDTFDTEILSVPAMDLIVYAKWADVPMVLVGEQGTIYTIPTGIFDDRTSSVEGGYLMATTETTYELWYEVRIWAEANGYSFDNVGREGNDGSLGAAPTEAKLEPVTMVSWRDVIVWSNAFSEMTGLDPVYRTEEGIIIKDARDSNASQVDAAVQTDNNGYRLPTSYEWEMAARWKDDTTSTDGSILVGGRYWTPGGNASGATADSNNATATNEVSWYSSSTDYPGGTRTTQPVGTKLPNALGLYDMSGNVWEWTYIASGSYRIIRGGSYYNSAGYLRVGGASNFSPNNSDPYYTSSNCGFRLVRGQ